MQTPHLPSKGHATSRLTVECRDATGLCQEVLHLRRQAVEGFIRVAIKVPCLSAGRFSTDHSVLLVPATTPFLHFGRSTTVPSWISSSWKRCLGSGAGGIHSGLLKVLLCEACRCGIPSHCNVQLSKVLARTLDHTPFTAAGSSTAHQAAVHIQQTEHAIYTYTYIYIMYSY